MFSLKCAMYNTPSLYTANPTRYRSVPPICVHAYVIPGSPCRRSVGCQDNRRPPVTRTGALHPLPRVDLKTQLRWLARPSISRTDRLEARNLPNALAAANCAENYVHCSRKAPPPSMIIYTSRLHVRDRTPRSPHRSQRDRATQAAPPRPTRARLEARAARPANDAIRSKLRNI